MSSDGIKEWPLPVIYIKLALKYVRICTVYMIYFIASLYICLSIRLPVNICILPLFIFVSAYPSDRLSVLLCICFYDSVHLSLLVSVSLFLPLLSLLSLPTLSTLSSISILYPISLLYFSISLSLFQSLSPLPLPLWFNPSHPTAVLTSKNCYWYHDCYDFIIVTYSPLASS